MAPRVTIAVDEGIADVRLNRPDKLNALDTPMLDGILRAGERLAADPSVRVVVLSGEGRGFCAGLDASSLGAIAGGSLGEADPEFTDAYAHFAEVAGPIADRMDGHITNVYQQVAQQWSDLAVPVIAACHGVVFGGGLQIALGADIRLTAPEAKWSVLEIRWGLLPDMTGIPQLVRLVGLDVVKELAFTGRMLSGTEAANLGVATRVSDDPRAEAMTLAREIAGKNPHAIRGMKALCNAAGGRSLAESYQEESRLMEGLIGSPNQVEATMAYLEKREPVFVDPES
ncbi:MAG TPA: crotonase/enoyl-CoA hydratase family protein [Acidimicrobiales bacterium]|nr:crotonase/enoyl-CoA hydratase family protein [Acidimicrobiales bacterium]